jgi:hypothetical protein
MPSIQLVGACGEEPLQCPLLTPFALCCVVAGYCGITAGHCGTGCQTFYGSCSGTSPPVTPSPSPKPVSSPTPSPKPVSSPSPAPPPATKTLPTGPIVSVYYESWSAPFLSSGASMDLAQMPRSVVGTHSVADSESLPHMPCSGYSLTDLASCLQGTQCVTAGTDHQCIQHSNMLAPISVTGSDMCHTVKLSPELHPAVT